MKQCGLILRQLFTGVKDSKRHDFEFSSLVGVFEGFGPQMSVLCNLKNAIQDLRLMDIAFTEYMLEDDKTKLWEKVLAEGSFTGRPLKQQLLEQIDNSFQKVYVAMKPLFKLK